MTKSKSEKLPAIQFYPGDWKKDPGIQSLDLETRGFWMELLFLMHESSERGVLLLNGKPFPVEALSGMFNLDNQKATKLLTKIIEYGVADQREDGAIYSRRMVKDEDIRRKRIKSGSMGGNPSLLNQNGSKLQPTGQPNGNQNTEDVNEDEDEDLNKKESVPPPEASDDRAWPPPVDPTDPLAKFLPDAYAQFEANSEICISSGRKPMRQYPEIWITSHELAEAFRVYDGVIPKQEWRRIFQKVKTWAKSKIANGQSAKKINTASAIMGWAMKEVVSELNEEAKLKRNSEART